MIIQRLARQRPSLRNVARCTNAQSRLLHHVPPLTHDASFKASGVPGMLSAEGFDMAWTQYQGLMVDRLNQFTAGTPDEGATAKTLLLNSARQADKAALFNHASMAHNNHFFFNCLSPATTAMPTQLANQLTADFSSLATLRAEMLATANALFGPGFVWLVHTTSPIPQYRLLTTYLAGSPYAGAHHRRQPADLSAHTAASLGGLSGADYARQTTVQNTAGAFGPSSQTPSARVPPGGVSLVPVLCVNAWEHVWLRDWGVGGKRAFLEAWWDRIDWTVVSGNADTSPQRAGRH
ncbi:MAG: hypothetical protein M1832_002292 [Thelocarpon impressellum]|nr:MAG: hypothetical protein M1832_002292 [Thelocarpon impressellum]